VPPSPAQPTARRHDPATCRHPDRGHNATLSGSQPPATSRATTTQPPTRGHGVTLFCCFQPAGPHVTASQPAPIAPTSVGDTPTTGTTPPSPTSQPPATSSRLPSHRPPPRLQWQAHRPLAQLHRLELPHCQPRLTPPQPSPATIPTSATDTPTTGTTPPSPAPPPPTAPRTTTTQPPTTTPTAGTASPSSAFSQPGLTSPRPSRRAAAPTSPRTHQPPARCRPLRLAAWCAPSHRSRHPAPGRGHVTTGGHEPERYPQPQLSGR
jgi:hypothetical protein